jgi:glycosyltransferase involved in cell wall biosynthesis
LKLRIAIACSGLGRTVRGFERFAAELARALRDHVDVAVFAAHRPRDLSGFTVPSVSRDTFRRLGMNPERAYYWEQATFAASLAPCLMLHRPTLVHVSDPALTNALLRIKRVVSSRPAVLFANGGALSPEHYARYDHVQLVAPWQAEEAQAAGLDLRRISVVPHGLFADGFLSLLSREEARRRLELPPGLLAISVAALDRTVKRLDYLIEEIDRPGARDWRLLLLGQRTTETAALEELARARAPGRVIFRTASPERVPDYLAASDLFLLASKREGFGLALAEAMAAGLPAVARDIPSLRHILSDDLQLSPMEPGALLSHLDAARSPETRRERGARNRQRVLEHFDWRALVPAYLEMYERALG